MSGQSVERKESAVGPHAEVELPTDYQKFIHISKYARWNEEQGRRETWTETVDRYMNFFRTHLAKNTKCVLTDAEYEEVRGAILRLEVMPSMRAMMTAGPALERDNMAGYNCAYIGVREVRDFAEILFVLLNGTGVGFGCGREMICSLPEVPTLRRDPTHIIIVQDSKEGWAEAYYQLLLALYGGIIPSWDLSLVRPAGERLKIFGGRASGPAPLEALFKFVINIFEQAQGRKLVSIEVHDIVCRSAESVIVGGVRRSALISLSNLSDDRMRQCKMGSWWELNPQRALANNSACYTERPDVTIFMKEWLALIESHSGERGIFNRTGAQTQVRRNCPTRDASKVEGTNPCCEILLRSRQTCNLTECIARAEDTPYTLREKIRIATILGTWQSTLTNFRFVSPEWKRNCEEERLLGVSLTGIMDNAFLSGQSKKRGRDGASSTDTLAFFLRDLRHLAVETNRIWADRLGINASTAITCVKPSGTVSQLTNTASGIHTRHSGFYKRTVRSSNNDPLTTFMKNAGYPWEPCVMKPNDTTIFTFPIKSPEGCITRDDMDATKQLEICKLYNDNYCSHKVSVTINVKDHEWMTVGDWIWRNFDTTSGISFLPHSNHSYRQAPYQECTKDEYEELLARMPKAVDWSELSLFEKSDESIEGPRELACAAGGCDL
jgi:ribonucleoside-diphosphate reductase alpha chain